MAWSFTVWSDWPEVWSEPCQAVWREVLAADPEAHAYQRPEVVRAWAETRGRAVEAKPAVALATHPAGTRAFLPWVVALHRGSRISRRILEPAGQSLFGYHDPLVAGPPLPEAAWADFWEAARRRLAGDCDQALFRFVHPRCGRGPRSRPCPDLSPVLPLAGLADLDALLSRCSANHRGDVRRRLRRLAEQGEIDLWVAGPGEAEAALADFRAGFLPAYRAAREGQPDLLLLPGVGDFAARLLSEGLPGGWGSYCALRVGGRAVAWHLGLCHAGDLLWWLPTYDPAWERFSPGKAMLAKLLEHAIGQGLRSVHFLTGGQPYKLMWQPDIPELRTVRWHSPSLRGRLLDLYDRWASR